jgi:aspartokinase-like uncharacterized kinase
MTQHFTIFKISGQILDNSKDLIHTIAQLTQLYEDNILQKILLIPGGGVLANFVREIYKEFNIGDDLAHWISIYSMNYNGNILRKKFPHIEIIEDLDLIKKKKRLFSIFLPYKELRKTDQLPHTWDLTSDSIAIYFANKLKLKECFLIKTVDGIIDKNNSIIQELNTRDYYKLKKEGGLAEFNEESLYLKEQTKPIDRYLTQFIDSYKIDIILLNGVCPNLRILNYFTSSNEGDKIFTRFTSKR